MGEYRSEPSVIAYIKQLQSRIERLENRPTPVGVGGSPTGAAGGALSGTYPNPGLANLIVVDANVSASAAIAESKLSLATDAAAGTGSRRTIGTGALQACAGNDGRLSDARTPSGSIAGDLAGSTWPTLTIAAGTVTRAKSNADQKAWSFLGGTQLGGSAVRTATITWTGTFQELHFEYFISGYSGAAIGRLIVGPTAGLSETGTTFCTNLIEGVTQNTTSVSVPGWPTAVTAAAVPRYGHMWVSNQAAVVKRMVGYGQHTGTAPTVVPVAMKMDGMFNDSTNLINKAELAVYAAITGAAISATTFNAGTYLNVWGRNAD